MWITPRIALTGSVVLLAGLAAALYLFSDAAANLWSVLLVEMQSIQRDLHRQLAAAMRAVRAEGATAAWALVVLSFLYGVFHAAGPGHGKVVISTYILTQESQLRRGLVLSLVSSLCQGVTAIAVVTATAALLGLTLREAQGAATGLETVSYGLVALFGFLLVASRLRRLWRRRLASASASNGSEPHSCGHHHHEHDAHCGHAHGPTLSELDAPLSWRGLAGMVASIGLRPCSGGVLVLLVAFSLELYWAGVAAVMAMSIGTAITVSLLAILSVYARQGALRLAALMPERAAGLGGAIDLVAVLGGIVILLAGVLMLQAALTIPAHPLR